MKSRFIDHPLAGEFLAAAERWAARGCAVGRASKQLNDLRNLAVRMLAEEPPPAA